MVNIQSNISLVENFVDKLQREEIPLHTQKILLKIYVDSIVTELAVKYIC